MIAIADSGATKCHWAVVDASGAVVKHIKTEGINPFSTTPDNIARVLREQFAPEVAQYALREIWFYGAGCIFEGAATLRTELQRLLPEAEIYVGSDMEGAARATCPDGNGIVCIMGTGSNSAQYEGGAQTAHVPALGYILGDEGSGTTMGRALVADALKGVLPQHLQEALHSEYSLTQAEALERVYHSTAANRYLASFAPFLSRHLDDEYIRALVTRHITAFVERNVAQYHTEQLSVNFVGSVAAAFEPILRAVLAAHRFHIGTVAASPLEGLIEYHTKRK